MKQSTALRHILVVEDETYLNEAYVTILQHEGYQVASAFEGEAALAAIKQQVPDLILLDLRMPRLDGIGFLRAAQPAKTMPATKIIVFTNFDEQKGIDEAFQLGAHKYLLKAWATPKELARVVATVLSDASS